MQTTQENATNHALLSVSEAAAYLDTPSHVIYKAIHSGLLVAEKQSGQWAVTQEDLETYHHLMSLVSEPAIPDIVETTEETSEEPMNTLLESVPVTYPTQTPSSPPQTTKTVQLRSGGFLTFSYSVDLFKADKPELDMLLSIVATIKNYEATQGTNHV